MIDEMLKMGMALRVDRLWFGLRTACLTQYSTLVIASILYTTSFGEIDPDVICVTC